MSLFDAIRRSINRIRTRHTQTHGGDKRVSGSVPEGEYNAVREAGKRASQYELYEQDTRTHARKTSIVMVDDEGGCISADSESVMEVEQ